MSETTTETTTQSTTESTGGCGCGGCGCGGGDASASKGVETLQIVAPAADAVQVGEDSRC